MKVLIQPVLLALAAGFMFACCASAAHAEPIYLAGNKLVPTMEAIQMAANGGVVYQCKPVELTVSKSGSGVSLKAKKVSK